MNPWHALRGRPDITVSYLELPSDLLGLCDHDSQTIYLTKGMRQRQRRSVLHHEMVHLMRGPVPDCRVLGPAEERAVERIAAAGLISISDLIDALMWSRDEEELAEELWTDVATVKDRLRHLTAMERQYVAEEIDRRT